MLISECSKYSPAGENPAEKNSRVDGRDFRIPQSFARIDIGPVIKKAAMIRKFFPVKAQRIQHAFPGLGAGNKPALVSNAKSRQAETGRGDAS